MTKRKNRDTLMTDQPFGRGDARSTFGIRYLASLPIAITLRLLAIRSFIPLRVNPIGLRYVSRGLGRFLFCGAGHEVSDRGRGHVASHGVHTGLTGLGIRRCFRMVARAAGRRAAACRERRRGQNVVPGFGSAAPRGHRAPELTGSPCSVRSSAASGAARRNFASAAARSMLAFGISSTAASQRRQ
jgi:hypothetical protein